MKKLIARGRQPGGGAEENMHRSGIGQQVNVFPVDPDGEVIESVSVEVPRGATIAEGVALLGLVGDSRNVLMPELIVGHLEAVP